MKYSVLSLIPGCVAAPAFATVVFSDDFNRADPGSAYSVSVSAGDGGASISGGAFLELTNDATASGNANGRVSVATAFSNFSAPFSGTLSSNGSLVTWETNFRYNRTTEPSGFAGGKYAAAFVLAGSQADFLGGTGYAVVYGSAGTPDPVRLVRYSGGLGADTNLTDLVSSGLPDLTAVNDYASLRVTYTASTGQWGLFVRDDGATAWADAATLDATSLKGVATDSTYTGSALTHAGFFWNYSTAANQTAQFDNLRVTAVPEPSSLILLGSCCAVGALARRRRTTPAR